MMGDAARPFAPFMDGDECEQMKRIAVMKALKDFRPDAPGFPTRLYRQIRWLLITHQRTEFRKRRVVGSLRDAAPALVAVREDPLERLEERLDAEAAASLLLSELDDSERSLVEMHFREGLSLRQIGEREGRHRRQVAASYHKAMAKMKKKADRTLNPEYH